MTKPLRRVMLQAVTRADRRETIARVRDAMQAGGANITDFHPFSNTAVNITFEIEGTNTRRLREELSAIGLTFDGSGLEELRLNHPSEVVGTLHITFVHNEPDLRIPVPPIPG